MVIMGIISHRIVLFTEHLIRNAEHKLLRSKLFDVARFRKNTDNLTLG